MTGNETNIIIAGDLAPIGRPMSLLTKGLVKDVFSNILSIIKRADYFIANLECPLTTAKEKLSKAGPKLKAQPGVSVSLAKAGINAVSLANNHMFDYGLKGIEETKSVLKQNGIDYWGVGENKAVANIPLYVDLNDLKLGFLAYAEHEFNWSSDDEWCTSILDPALNVLQVQHTARECDAVIVLLHAGPESWHYPSPRVVKTCRAFAEAGAAAVLVAHSHTVMGAEYYNGVPIVYGLGNFLFDAGPEKNVGWRLGQLAHLVFDQHKKPQLLLIPLLANGNSGCIDLLPEKFIPHFNNFQNALSEPLSHLPEIEELWKAFCASQADHLAKECIKAALAMAPYAIISKFYQGKINQSSYYIKGANIFRGLLMCENHQDVLSQIFDLVRTQQFQEYRLKALHRQSLINQYYQEFSDQ